MSAPTTSGLYHVSSSLPSSSNTASVLFAAGDDKPLYAHTTSHDALYRTKTARSKSFIQKPVVLLPSALDKKADDRGSSGSNSSTTSTASTGTDDRRSSLLAPSTSAPTSTMAPIHPPPSHAKDSHHHYVLDRPPTSSTSSNGSNHSQSSGRKSMRKSASNIIASSLGIVGATTQRSSLSKSYSTNSTSPQGTATVLSMPQHGTSPSGSLDRALLGNNHSVRSSSARSSTPSSTYDELAPTLSLALSAERRAALTEFIDKSVDDAYNLCHGFGRIRWHPFKTREGVSICRAHGEDDQRLDAAVRGKCNVNATFHEMLDALTTETTDDFVAHENAVNPSEFLDGLVLATLVPRTPDDRYVCLKWHCIKSLAPSVAKHRDYVYVEVVDQFVDHDGKRIGYRLAKSVEVDEMTGLIDQAHAFVRGKTLTLQTFTEVSQGNLELYTMLINDLGERLPTWLVHKIVDTAAMRVACIRDHINQRRIDVLVYANAKDLVPLTKRVCCIVCTKSFSLVRKKYNCVACGDVMCNQCSVHQLVSAQGLSEFVGKRKARICVKCSSGLTATELPRRSNLARSSDLSSDRSTTATTRTSSERSRPGSMLESRSGRALSSQDVTASSSSGSRSSVEDPSGSRVHPAGSAPRPSTIPHMFQFRPAPAKPEPRAPSVADEHEMPLEPTGGDVESEEDDDMEHELFDATVDISAIAPQDLDLGVGKYKEVYVQQSKSERAVDNFLMEEAIGSEPVAAVASFLTQDCVVEHLANMANSAPVLTTMEELIVEEMVPGNSASSGGRASSFSQPRQSVSMLTDDDDDAPVIVRKVAKLSIGAGGRKSRSDGKRPRAPPPPMPPTAPTHEPETADFTADFTVPVEAVEITPTTPAPVEDAEPTLQLSDLQVHLDRMTQISQSLRNLNVEKIESSTEATNAMRRLESFEKRANAEVAAVIAANFLSALEKNGAGGLNDRSQYVPAAVQPTGPPRFILTLAMGDGSIADFLHDSVFAELTEPAEGVLAGWQTVQSRSTGKVYYYNASCGATSWTVPVPELHRGAVYMVL